MLLKVTKLSRVGGRTVGSSTRRILAMLFDNQFASEWSWLGSRGGKNSFHSSVLKNVVYGKS